MEKIRELIVEHSSLLVMGIGAISIFLANILLKDILSEIEYGIYSIFITYVSIIGSFGLLGFEQVFLRVTDNSDKDYLRTDKTLIIILLFIWLVFGLIFSYSFKYLFIKDKIDVYFLFVSTLGISLSMFLFNAFRINSNFFVSQIFSNYWKIALFAFSISIYFIGISHVKIILYLTGGMFISVSVFGAIKFFRSIEIKLQKRETGKKIFHYALQFFISLLTLSILGQGDKLLIEKSFGIEKLGEYFYLANIFVFPFSMLQSYVGFKELVNFKKSFSKLFFIQKIRRINLMGLLLCPLLILISWAGAEFGFLEVNLKENLWMIIVFLATGVMKLNYALLSSVFGAIGEVKSIFRANFQFLVLSLILMAIVYSRMDSLLIVSIIFLMFWVIRVTIWNFNINKQVNEIKV